VDSFIVRRSEDLSEAKSKSQEDMRLEMSCAFLNEKIRCLRESVDVIKAELRFNFNDVGISEREDRTSKKGIVTKTIAGEKVHYHVSRIVKRTSRVARITAAAESLMPCVVTSQGSEPLRKRRMRQVVRTSVHLVLQE
jgi:hypothetical protein